ncbi:YwqG family protein [Streptosporangium sandarakinum]|uniref:YwqG family protein n=1 Tax=Streptosporangium sandarakinum TaxID=1260955 RepID=UPI00341909DF
MTDGRYSRLAAEHLPADLAERWTALLRPCIRLRRVADGEQAVAALGGEPELPAGAVWPEWPGHGPLSFIASVRCALLPRAGLTAAFPQDGTLLFFYFDGQDDNADDGSFVSPHDPETWAGAQVLYVPGDTPVFRVETPRELEPYPHVELAAGVEESAPDLWLPQAREALLGDGRHWPDLRETPARLRPFLRAFRRLRTRIDHQIGGHAVPVQGPVEYEIANAALGSVHSWGTPVLDREAGRWVLLAQFDSDGDAKMMWGDTGALYWLIRPEHLATHRFDQARLTVQC